METPAGLEIRIQPLAGSRLLADYHVRAAGLRPFFNGHPSSAASFRRKAAEVDGRFDAARRERMAGAITPSSEGARRKLEDVVERGGLLITTGQQAGLFGGPLYTIYKAVAAARWAQTLEDALQRPVAPLFWVASEDHDWAEVNHTFVLDRSGALRRIGLDGAGGTGASMAHTRPTEGWSAVLNELTHVVDDTAFTPAVLGQIRDAYVDGATVAAGFRVLLSRLLAPLDLLLTDAADPALKAQSTEVLVAAATDAAADEAAVAGQTARLEAAGYPAQVPVLDAALNLFYEGAAGRERLVRAGGEIRAREAGVRWSAAELAAAIRAEPGAFSPNVMLRPVVETTVFPTVAYVGGPAEIAYHAQLGCLFDRHGVEMPIVVPRASALLIEPKVARAMGKLGMEPAAFGVPAHELAMRIARDVMPGDVARRLTALRETIARDFGALAEAALPIDPTLEGPLRSARLAAEKEVERAERKILRRLKARHEVELQHAERVRASLWPQGSPQERVLNVVPFLARYGPELPERLLAALPAPALDAEDWGDARCGEPTGPPLAPAP